MKQAPNKPGTPYETPQEYAERMNDKRRECYSALLFVVCWVALWAFLFDLIT